MLPSDLVLIQDPEFKKYVGALFIVFHRLLTHDIMLSLDLYSKDEKRFFKDFAAVFQKLEELGTEGLYDV
jgi:hypothetical protein